MEFCPKCGGLMLPKKIGKGRKLICQKCGHKIELKRGSKYKIKTEKKREEKVTVVTKKEKKKKKPVRYEVETEPIEYYEEFFEE
ncbi:MAG: hypothetical protein QXU01_01135 [Candidatus Hadarchaeales archaeon]